MTDLERVERLARNAHNAWMEACKQNAILSRKAEWGEEFMVPYDNLSERGKEFDRIIVRSMLESIKSNRREIVCLCGSTRFKQAFIKANFRETMAGRIVLSVGLYSHADSEVYTPTEKEKRDLDMLHFDKIDLADQVLFLNEKRPQCPECFAWVDERDTECICPLAPKMMPYIGESTSRELSYARQQGKKIRWLYPDNRALPGEGP